MAEQPMEFQFVNSTLTNPSVPQDLAIRALIRKQAMKKASAARRRDGNYGKHNLRQYPVFVHDEKPTDQTPAVKVVANHKTQSAYGSNTSRQLEYIDGEERGKGRSSNGKLKLSKHEREKNIAERQMLLTKIALAESAPSKFSPTGYELLLAKSGVDIMELSTLATLHVGRATRRALCASPYSIVHQMRTQKQWSFLSYLPSRYGHIQCLSDAADCVVARARQIISPQENWEPMVLGYYIKALESLQKALDSPKQRFKPEVLCATEILALYELLEPTGETAWIRHAAGAARLIQLRGPSHYTSEFEQALFLGHTGPIMTEALLNGERCFLEQPAWQKLFRSIIAPNDTSMSDRSELVIVLIMLKSNIPGTFCDITQILCQDTDPEPEYIDRMIKFCRMLRRKFLEWRRAYEELVSKTSVREGTMEFDRRCKAFATYLSCIMFTNRLLGCLVAEEREALERETQGLADEMLSLDEEVQVTSKAANLFMAQTAGVAGAMKITRREFEEGVGRKEEGIRKGFVEKDVFMRWCATFGRTVNYV
ncbi:C6 zinc finger domain protein [Rutstroemia sp. NJR-2017a WRK4]|nr:C6 zinc finger domain protein [Rutstroemia sp. NJR-2017a WRK4]